jgi:hypothetical protein
LRVGIGGLDVGQRMGKGLGGRIWHSEHNTERDAQFLCAMDMGKAWGIGDDAVGNKWSCCRLGVRVVPRELGKVIVGNSVAGFVTRSPAALNVLGNISSLLTDIST